ncbi:MAG TPA: flagellar M-ring protein FliF C-terminal domain-containing protein, partial [Steroidobacteraceae bacterium]|nr:flagellar M-ring protein FliF C-terminal domain-containing protein [Steroidobacteraceae bacterium]
DQQGRLLSTPDGHDEFSLREQQFDMAHRLEDDYRQRVESLLAPLVGAGRVRAQVVAQMDMSSTEEAREQYRPDSQIVRSEQTSEQSTRDAGGSQGVPGALSNQPPAAGVASAPPPTAAPAAAQNNGNGTGASGGKPAAAAAGGAAAGAAGALAAPTTDTSSKETTRNYEIDRTLAYTRQPAGKLKRLTVAVLIDDARTVDKDGKTHSVALSKDQLDHVTQLVKDAVGFDESRGDVVNVVNSSFTEEPAAPEGTLESPPIWEKPLFFDLLKIVMGAVVLIVLVLTVLRPLMRTLLGTLRTPRLEAADTPALEQAAAAAPQAALAHEQQLVQARTLVGQDPKRVAQVVREWVDQDG